MTDGGNLPLASFLDETSDACVDALGKALAMLKAAEAADASEAPSLAEIMRQVRLMESQPEHAIARLRAALDRQADMPQPERIRRIVLQARGHSEESLKHLPAGERDALETAIAEDIRRHFGISGLPPQKRSRPAPFAPHSF